MIQTTLSTAVLSKYKNPYFLETGTANADCVRLALEVGFDKIFSIELDSKLQDDNISRYADKINSGIVNLITGDSLLEMYNLIPVLDKPTTFWLDAHVDFGPNGIKKCPLYEELDAIKQSKIKTHTILIDDVRIFGAHWGEGISIEGLQKKLLEINPLYEFTYEDGFAPNDILIAYLPEL
jgi:hypothetical protein